MLLELLKLELLKYFPDTEKSAIERRKKYHFQNKKLKI